jgi:hypothetical protein
MDKRNLRLWNDGVEMIPTKTGQKTQSAFTRSM